MHKYLEKIVQRFTSVKKDVSLKPVLNISYAMPQIAATFNDMPYLLDTACLLYGGAIRDTLAGIELLGDLDIAVPSTIFSSQRREILDTRYWQSVLLQTARSYNKTMPENVWKVIEEVSTLEHIKSKRKVQLIKVLDDDFIGNVISILDSVDLRCCSVCATLDGTVFESLDCAVNDCIQKVLVPNEKADLVNKKNLDSRILKLKNRGYRQL